MHADAATIRNLSPFLDRGHGICARLAIREPSLGSLPRSILARAQQTAAARPLYRIGVPGLGLGNGGAGLVVVDDRITGRARLCRDDGDGARPYSPSFS
jgi:hypothetical protein